MKDYFRSKIPSYIQTERLYLRPYQTDDETWFYEMSQKNRTHLTKFESGNVVMEVHTMEDARNIVRDLAAEWAARRSFFLGVFDKNTHEFVAQKYIGPLNWDLPEFELGYFADKDHQGQGFVTEAVKEITQFIFKHLNAHRIRVVCDDTNLRSIRVAERCGMVREGHICENKKDSHDYFTGTVIFGLLQQEF